MTKEGLAATRYTDVPSEDRLTPEESAILSALLHLNVPGKMLRLTAMQVRMELEQAGFKIVRKE